MIKKLNVYWMLGILFLVIMYYWGVFYDTYALVYFDVENGVKALIFSFLPAMGYMDPYVRRLVAVKGDDDPNGYRNEFFKLCMLSMLTCSVYYIYWIYKTGQELREMAPRYRTEVTGSSAVPVCCEVIYSVVHFLVIVIGMSGGLTAGACKMGMTVAIIAEMVTLWFMTKDINQLIDGYNACNGRPAGTAKPAVATPPVKKDEVVEENLPPREPPKADNISSGTYEHPGFSIDSPFRYLYGEDSEPDTIEEPYEPRHYLMCRGGIYTGANFPLMGFDYMMVGRDATHSHIVITGDTRVSRQHFQIRFSPSSRSFEIVDCSSVGTYLNEQKIPKGQIIACKKGDIIRMGESDNVFELQ